MSNQPYTSTLRGQISHVGAGCVALWWLWMSRVYVEWHDPCSGLQNSPVCRCRCLRVCKLLVARLGALNIIHCCKYKGTGVLFLRSWTICGFCGVTHRWCREEGDFLKPEEVWDLSSWLWELLPKPGNTKILLPYAAKLLCLRSSNLAGLHIRRNISGWQCCLVVWTIPWVDFFFLLTHRELYPQSEHQGFHMKKNTDANCRNLCSTMLGLIKGKLKKSLFSNTSLQSHCVGI